MTEREACTEFIIWLPEQFFKLVFPKKQTEILETGTMQDYILKKHLRMNVQKVQI